jgi:osmotically-inducible protein OsmY
LARALPRIRNFFTAFDVGHIEKTAEGAMSMRNPRERNYREEWERGRDERGEHRREEGSRKWYEGQYGRGNAQNENWPYSQSNEDQGGEGYGRYEGGQDEQYQGRGRSRFEQSGQGSWASGYGESGRSGRGSEWSDREDRWQPGIGGSLDDGRFQQRPRSQSGGGQGNWGQQGVGGSNRSDWDEQQGSSGQRGHGYGQSGRGSGYWEPGEMAQSGRSSGSRSWSGQSDWGQGERGFPNRESGQGQSYGQSGYGQSGGGRSASGGYGANWGRGSGAEQGRLARNRRGPKGYKRSDERIKEDISERLSQEVDLDIVEVMVEVTDGTVTLQGTVPERWMKHRMEDIADESWGVKDVENRIRVSQGGESNQAFSSNQDAAGDSRGMQGGSGSTSTGSSSSGSASGSSSASKSDTRKQS